MARNRCHIHNLYWFDASGSNCEAFFYITSVDSTTINYTINSSEYPVYIRLYNGETLVDTNTHMAEGDYIFTGTFAGQLIISYSNPCGADIVYQLDFDCICPEGYEAVGEECRKIDDISATVPITPSTLVKETYFGYSSAGTVVYDTNWDINGVGTVTNYFSDNWWKNNPEISTEGPLNRTGVWSNNKTSNQDVGFTFCANINETKTYWVGVGSDNYIYIKVNGVLVFQQDLTLIRTSLGAQGYPTFSADQMSWKYWMIYPVILEAGKNVIEVVGHNISLDASLGCEIYNAPDAATIGTWQSYADMGENLLFTSKNEIGNEVQIGNLGYGYECPEGYSLVLCEDTIVCRKIDTLGCGETPPLELTESYETVVYSNNVGTSGPWDGFAQAVTSSAGLVGRIDINMRDIGNPSYNLTCSIYDGHVVVNDSQPPSTTLLGISDNIISSDNVTSTNSTFSFNFAAGVTVGTQYSIIFTFSDIVVDGSNYPSIGYGATVHSNMLWSLGSSTYNFSYSGRELSAVINFYYYT